MIKKVIACLLIFSIFILNTSRVYAEPNLLCTTAVLIDANTGTILAENVSCEPD